MENAVWSGSGGSRLYNFFLCLHYKQSICPYFKYKKKSLRTSFFQPSLNCFILLLDVLSTQVLYFVFYMGVSMPSHVMVRNHFIPFHGVAGCCCWSQSSRVLPGQVASSSQGPHWWAVWGSVSCSRTLRHAAQPSPESGGDILITSWPALPTELQPPEYPCFFEYISMPFNLETDCTYYSDAFILTTSVPSYLRISLFFFGNKLN